MPCEFCDSGKAVAPSCVLQLHTENSLAHAELASFREQRCGQHCYIQHNATQSP